MTDTFPHFEDSVDALIERGLVSLRGASPVTASLLDDANLSERVGKVILVSDFALETLRRQPELLVSLADDDGAAPIAPPILQSEESSRWQEQLRRYRTAESTRLIWRDVHDLDDVDALRNAMGGCYGVFGYVGADPCDRSWPRVLNLLDAGADPLIDVEGHDLGIGIEQAGKAAATAAPSSRAATPEHERGATR